MQYIGGNQYEFYNSQKQKSNTNTENQKQAVPKEVEAPKLIIATESAEIEILKRKNFKEIKMKFTTHRIGQKLYGIAFAAVWLCMTFGQIAPNLPLLAGMAALSILISIYEMKSMTLEKMIKISESKDILTYVTKGTTLVMLIMALMGALIYPIQYIAYIVLSVVFLFVNNIELIKELIDYNKNKEIEKKAEDLKATIADIAKEMNKPANEPEHKKEPQEPINS